MTTITTSPAEARLTRDGGRLRVIVSGAWSITSEHPCWDKMVADQAPADVLIEAEQLGAWDSSLVLFIEEINDWCRKGRVKCDHSGLPSKLAALCGQMEKGQAKRHRVEREDFFTMVGLATRDVWSKTAEIVRFVGECTISAWAMAKRPGKFRWRDCLNEMQQCGAMALPIVSLVSFLVGLILAYQAAVQLRQFGADIFVADLIGLSVVREMGPIMAAVVLAGRTGAAFAAQIGNMKANEEIDALEVLGISPVNFLVLPRVLALTIMMPMLALYANCLGILGGMMVAAGLLDIPPSAYWIETQSIIDLSDLNTGLFKSFVFGALIAMAGCLRGLQADRNAAGVGRAATSAVVTSILLIIVADAVFAVIFNILGV